MAGLKGALSMLAKGLSRDEVGRLNSRELSYPHEYDTLENLHDLYKSGSSAVKRRLLGTNLSGLDENGDNLYDTHLHVLETPERTFVQPLGQYHPGDPYVYDSVGHSDKALNFDYARRAAAENDWFTQQLQDTLTKKMKKVN